MDHIQTICDLTEQNVIAHNIELLCARLTALNAKIKHIKQLIVSLNAEENGYLVTHCIHLTRQAKEIQLDIYKLSYILTTK